MKKRAVNIEFPLAGLHKGAALQRQSPYSTPACKNVFPEDALQGRARGGSRPGLTKAFDDQMGSTDKRVRMISAVTVAKTDGFTIWQDTFDGSALGDSWTAASWCTDGLPDLLPEDMASVAYDEIVGGVADALDINTASAYEISIFIVPYLGEHHGKYQIFGGMNDTTPVATTNGWIVELDMTGDTGEWTGTATTYTASTPTEYALTPGETDLGAPQTGWLKVLYTASGTKNLKVWWNGTSILDQNITLGASAGSRVGFGMECTEASGICLVDIFRCQFYSNDTSERHRDILVASADGTVYAEALAGQLSAVSSNLSLQDDRRIDAAQRSQILYIADHGDPIIDTTASSSGDTITITGVTESNCNKYDYVVEVTDGTGTITDGLYMIDTVGTGSIKCSATVGTGDCTVRVDRGLKTYTPSTGALALVTPSDGWYPVGAPHICVYRDRLCLAKEHILYFSRQADFTDWDFGIDPDDAAKAIASNYSDAGQIGDIITAVIPFSDDYLIIGCRNSLWIQEGDLAFQAEINNITNDTAIVMRGAWCRGPAGSLFFLGPDGINYMGPGAKHPENISRSQLPRELRQIDTNIYQVAMAYSHRRRGILLTLAPETSTGIQQWWFDFENRGIWPLEFSDTDQEPFFPYSIRASGLGESDILIGCRDGYIRILDDNCETDDGGETITNYVDIGPFNLGDDYQAGSLDEIITALATGSGDVTWSLRVDESAQEVVDSTDTFVTGTWVAGHNYPVLPRAYGKCAILRLAGSGTSKWAMERVTAVLSARGMHRRFT